MGFYSWRMETVNYSDVKIKHNGFSLRQKKFITLADGKKTN